MRAFLTVLGLLVATPALQAEPAKPTQQIERGRYLVNTSGCMDCHTAMKPGPKGPERDFDRHLAGHPQEVQLPPAPKLPEGPWGVTMALTGTAYNGPWGTSYGANLTPDPETGLGRWTEADFIATFRTGKRMGRGREILPPMPIPVYKNFSDADLKAVFAYLRTLPAIKNKVPEPQPPAQP